MIQEFIIYVSGPAKDSATGFKNLTGIWSGPVEQSALSPFIYFNTKMRSTSKNAFEKNFFKLMNNSIYGKTMENLRKRVDVKLVSSKDDLLKLVASPCFQSHRIMNENLIVVSKPCYVGMSILDLSKTLMYDFHYNTIKKEYGDRAKLLFTDTDSLKCMK